MGSIEIVQEKGGDDAEQGKPSASASASASLALSPVSLLFHEPGTNCCIIAIIGCNKKLDAEIIKGGLSKTLIKHPRFSTKLQVSEGGKKRWIQTEVNLENHVIIPEVDTEMEMPKQFIDDYISHLTTIPMDLSKPLWELHLLNLKTEEAESVGILRIHHSIGDGMSLISLLLACCRKSSDPESLPTLPKPKPKQKTDIDDDRQSTRGMHYMQYCSGSLVLLLLTSVWSVLRLVWNTIVDLFLFLGTVLLEDTKTPLKGSSGVGQNPKRILHRTLSFDDIKLVKDALGMTVNDVILGVTQAGLSRYLKRKYGEVDVDGGKQGAKRKSNRLIPRNIRLRATILVNIRKTAGIQALADMMNNKSKAKWGNKIGYICIPLTVAPQTDHPFDHLRRAKAIADRKKHSLEAIFTYSTNKFVINLFGSKLSAALVYRYLFNTTMSFSNVAGPVEEVCFFGHPITFIAPTVCGHPQALTCHFQSYNNKMIIVVAVDPTVIPDPHLLCDDFEESLKIFKDTVVSTMLAKDAP